MRSSSLKTVRFGLIGKGIALAVMGCGLLSTPVLAAAKKAEGASSESGLMAQSQVTASIMRSYRPIGMIQVDVALLVTDDALQRQVNAARPVLQSAWRSTVQEFAANYYTPGRVPDAVLLGQRLQAATDAALGKRGARLLLASVVVR
jgi:hypothetical protein